MAGKATDEPQHNPLDQASGRVTDARGADKATDEPEYDIPAHEVSTHSLETSYRHLSVQASGRITEARGADIATDEAERERFPSELLAASDHDEDDYDEANVIIHGCNMSLREVQTAAEASFPCQTCDSPDGWWEGRGWSCDSCIMNLESELEDDYDEASIAWWV